MILSDWDIANAIGRGVIKIDPMKHEDIRTNSVDVHLSEHLSVYDNRIRNFRNDPKIAKYNETNGILDAKIENKTKSYSIDIDGIILMPGILYLGSTIEYTEAHEHVPFLEGKSSVGRLGISVHCTAGVGDVGFCGHWTLEISVIQPVRVYAGMPIAQLLFFDVKSKPLRMYGANGSKYQQQGAKPVASMMWKNFIK